jgi:hypothetical protein
MAQALTHHTAPTQITATSAGTHVEPITEVTVVVADAYPNFSIRGIRFNTNLVSRPILVQY